MNRHQQWSLCLTLLAHVKERMNIVAVSQIFRSSSSGLLSPRLCNLHQHCVGKLTSSDTPYLVPTMAIASGVSGPGGGNYC